MNRGTLALVETKRALPSSDVAVVPASPPQWIVGYHPHHHPPVPVPSSQIRRELAVWDAACEPADLQAIAVLLEHTLKLFGLPENWDDIAEFYLEALEDVPLDIVRDGLKRIRLESVFFPKPAEIRRALKDKLDERESTRLRLDWALTKRIVAEEEQRKRQERDERVWRDALDAAKNGEPGKYGALEWTAWLHVNYGYDRDAAGTLYSSWYQFLQGRRPYAKRNPNSGEDILRVTKSLRAAHGSKPADIEAFMSERLKVPHDVEDESLKSRMKSMRAALATDRAIFNVDDWVAWLCRRHAGGQMFALLMLTGWHEFADKDLARLQAAMLDLQREDPSSDHAFMAERLKAPGS